MMSSHGMEIIWMLLWGLICMLVGVCIGSKGSHDT